MSNNNINDFANWPASEQQQETLAGEIFGQYLVAAYDSWLQTSSRMLFENYKYKNPNSSQKRMFDWIANASEEDRKNVSALIREITSGLVFSILNNIDGTSGSIINDSYTDRIRIFLDIYREEYEVEGELERVASVPINAQDDANLHDRWYKWLTDYSRHSE